jgi:murein hydrolase activator
MMFRCAALPIRWVTLCGLAIALVGSASNAPAQSSEEKLKAQREELARIRKEREELERTMDELKGKAHNLADEVNIIDRRRDKTRQLMVSLDKQLGSIGEEVALTSAQLDSAEKEAINKRGTLHHRLVDIYKRGPTFAWEALLSAASFGQLVTRYKYLHQLAKHDRSLVHRMEDLKTRIKSHRDKLVALQDELEDTRTEKAREEAKLKTLEAQMQRSLDQVKQESKKAEARMRRLAKAEAELNGVIANLESARRRGTRSNASAARTSSSVRTSDLGKLDWPVDGQILYRYGKVVNENNTTTRWNGIGISAAEGTAVKAVSSGEVVYIGEMGTYGKTVIVEHGGGDYSVYSSLANTSVTKGTKVAKGQSIGTVGVTDPAFGPHLHFEIRRAGGQASDPFEWLREQ